MITITDKSEAKIKKKQVKLTVAVKLRGRLD